MKQEKKEFNVQVQMQAQDLWRYSLYHSNRGYLGFFNVLFTLAAVYLLIVQWGELDVPYRMLLVVCALIFTVWQPALLYLKAKKQSQNPAMKKPICMAFTEEGFSIAQGDQTLSLAWDQIVRAERGFGQIIFYTDRIHAYLLPDRCLEADRDAFVKLLGQTLPKERRKRI